MTKLSPKPTLYGLRAEMPPIVMRDTSDGPIKVPRPQVCIETDSKQTQRFLSEAMAADAEIEMRAADDSITIKIKQSAIGSHGISAFVAEVLASNHYQTQKPAKKKAVKRKAKAR